MEYMTLTLDGITYRVRVVYDTYADTFELVEGPNAGDMLSGDRNRDLIGTKATYEMRVEPDPRYPADFDAFYAAVRAPVDTHSITVYDGQTTLTYQAMIQSGSRVLRGTVGGVRRYRGSTIRFVPSAPQWEAAQ